MVSVNNKGQTASNGTLPTLVEGYNWQLLTAFTPAVHTQYALFLSISPDCITMDQ